jgi:hypothetical protein
VVLNGKEKEWYTN